MPAKLNAGERVAEALHFQQRILPEVSRTFALTIPQLPAGLYECVANAYLLCRIADTIEDEPALTTAEKDRFQQRLVGVIAGDEPARGFAEELVPRLSDATLPAERELIAGTAWVVTYTHTLQRRQQQALLHCVAIMGKGMSQYQRDAGPQGLVALPDLDEYCYYVAGVVGEMLTDLFCSHDARIERQYAQLMRLAPSFGESLQLINILKDVWADRARGVCWWPREVFERHGVELEQLEQYRGTDGYRAALDELIGVAHGHLRNALAYTLRIPARQRGIRQFCLWALGLAVLTLRNIHARPDYAAAAEVKVSRRRVKQVMLASRLAGRSDRLLRGLFGLAARGLPLQRVEAVELPSRWLESDPPALHQIAQ